MVSSSFGSRERNVRRWRIDVIAYPGFFAVNSAAAAATAPPISKPVRKVVFIRVISRSPSEQVGRM
jgi:hypothetical protein